MQRIGPQTGFVQVGFSLANQLAQNINWIPCNQQDATRILQANLADEAAQYRSRVA
jgi:hypothetical protein